MLFIILLKICFDEAIVTAKVAVIEMIISEIHRPSEIFLFIAAILSFKKRRLSAAFYKFDLYYGFET